MENVSENLETKTYKCTYCEKEFSSGPAKCQHVKFYCPNNDNKVKRTRKPKHSDKVEQNPPTIDPNNKGDLISLVSTLCELVKSCIEMKGNQPYVSTITNTTSHVVNSTNNSNNTSTTNNIIINTFGQETLHHITPEFLSECIKTKSKGIVKLLEKVHRDPDVPENHNVRKKSEKKGTVETYENGRWVIRDKNTVMDDLISRGYKILYKYHLENPPKENDDMYSYDEFISNLMNCKNIMYYKVRKNVYLMITNENICILEKK